MIALLNKLPEQVKLAGDGVALLTSIAAIAGQLTTILGFVGMALTVAWGIYRLLNEYKEYKRKK